MASQIICEPHEGHRPSIGTRTDGGARQSSRNLSARQRTCVCIWHEAHAMGSSSETKSDEHRWQHGDDDDSLVQCSSSAPSALPIERSPMLDKSSCSLSPKLSVLAAAVVAVVAVEPPLFFCAGFLAAATFSCVFLPFCLLCSLNLSFLAFFRALASSLSVQNGICSTCRTSQVIWTGRCSILPFISTSASSGVGPRPIPSSASNVRNISA
mmetsp:Transcript_8672/g.24364  ORF Transcript_8672/g.24364 Transcript_8672/m.24364 type:complete len:211 (+) Transcript_8672:173-805(+)